MNSHLENIEQKVRQLLAELQTLRQQNTALTDENKSLKAQLETQNKRLEEVKFILTNTQRAVETPQQQGDEKESSRKVRK